LVKEGEKGRIPLLQEHFNFCTISLFSLELHSLGLDVELEGGREGGREGGGGGRESQNV
jgi:hypothetical protein